MPPVIIALGVLGFAAWWAGRNTPSATPAPQPVAFVNEQPGVVTGTGGTPGIQSSTNPIPTASVAQNQPSASASGVPNFSPQSQAYNRGNFIPNVNFGHWPLSYAPAQRFIGAPQQAATQPVNTPVIPAQGTSSTPAPAKSCGCGGSCSGGCPAPSGCQTTNSRYPDGRGGCMAVSKKQLIANTPPQVIGHVANQINSSGLADFFNITQQHIFDYQTMNGDTVPAGPALN